MALGVERSYGRGRMAASTFRLFRDAPMADPTATMLLDRLVELVARIAGGCGGRRDGAGRGGRGVATRPADLAVSRRERVVNSERRVQGIEHRLADEAVAARLAVADRIP